MNKRAELAEKKARYLRLKSLTDYTGWKDFEKLVREEYCNALDILKDSASDEARHEARGTLKFIEKLMDSVNTELRFGAKATEDYTKLLNREGE